jgi:DMSO reductase anchor subunit
MLLKQSLSDTLAAAAQGFLVRAFLVGSPLRIPIAYKHFESSWMGQSGEIEMGHDLSKECD